MGKNTKKTDPPPPEMPKRPKIKGVTLNLGGEDYVVPGLNLNQLEETADLIEKLSGANAKEGFQILATLALAALNRNYPEMTLQQVKEIIDLNNLAEVTSAIFRGSGLVPGGLKPVE